MITNPAIIRPTINPQLVPPLGGGVVPVGFGVTVAVGVVVTGGAAVTAGVVVTGGVTVGVGVAVTGGVVVGVGAVVVGAGAATVVKDHTQLLDKP